MEVNPSLPVLVVARFLDVDCYLEAMQLGAMDYLVEPLTVWEIGRLLERHSRANLPESSSEIALPRTDLEGRNFGPAIVRKQFWNKAPQCQACGERG
jgi:DNA-binding NtrC family response regulator